MEESLNEIIVRHIGDFTSPQQSRNAFEEWDSITHLRMIMEIGSSLGVKVTPEIVESIDSIDDIHKWIKDVKG